MKATEQYFPVVLFNMLYKLSTLSMKSYSVPIQTKTSERYFLRSLFILRLFAKIIKSSLFFSVSSLFSIGAKEFARLS